MGRGVHRVLPAYPMTTGKCGRIRLLPCGVEGKGARAGRSGRAPPGHAPRTRRGVATSVERPPGEPGGPRSNSRGLPCAVRSKRPRGEPRANRWHRRSGACRRFWTPRGAPMSPCCVALAHRPRHHPAASVERELPSGSARSHPSAPPFARAGGAVERAGDSCLLENVFDADALQRIIAEADRGKRRSRRSSRSRRTGASSSRARERSPSRRISSSRSPLLRRIAGSPPSPIGCTIWWDATRGSTTIRPSTARHGRTVPVAPGQRLQVRTAPAVRDALDRPHGRNARERLPVGRASRAPSRHAAPELGPGYVCAEQTPADAVCVPARAGTSSRSRRSRPMQQGRITPPTCGRGSCSAPDGAVKYEPDGKWRLQPDAGERSRFQFPRRRRGRPRRDRA
jgi:hypothetical protein